MKKNVYLILSFFFVSHAMAMEIEDSDWNDLSLSDSCSAAIELYCANDTSLIRILDTISKAKENVREYVISYEKKHGDVYMLVYQIAYHNDIMDWIHGTNYLLKNIRPIGCIMFNDRSFYFALNNLDGSSVDKLVSKTYKWQVLKRIPEEFIDEYRYYMCDHSRVYKYVGNSFVQYL